MSEDEVSGDVDPLHVLIKNFIKNKDEIIMDDIARMASSGVLTVYETRPTMELMGSNLTMHSSCRLMFTGEMKINEQKREIEKLKSENAVMREALEFIADPSITDHPFKNDMKALEHVGYVARCALAKIKDEE